MTIKLAVTGLTGQVVSALIERAPHDVEIIALGRPQLDLSMRSAVLGTLRSARCDVIVNAAAYTAVDRAESEPDVAMRVNGEGAGFVAEIAAELGAPLVHLSTDCVFDGALGRPYRETDAPGPISAYGRSKLAGEARIAAIHPDHAILRTSWVYSPFGENFVKTMLRLATQDKVRVVADRIGSPTSALDLADAIVAVARRLRADRALELRGVFHMTGSGEASWADFACAIFAEAQALGHAPVSVERIAGVDYPTAARRPANSRLDNAKLAAVYGLALPDWRKSTKECVVRLLMPGAA